MEGKKNYFEAENLDQAKKIARRLKNAGFFSRSGLDRLLVLTSYPCRFYTNDADEIVIDYTPGGGWKSFKDFVGSWMERPNYKKSLKKNIETGNKDTTVLL